MYWPIDEAQRKYEAEAVEGVVRNADPESDNEGARYRYGAETAVEEEDRDFDRCQGKSVAELRSPDVDAVWCGGGDGNVLRTCQFFDR